MKLSFYTFNMDLDPVIPDYEEKRQPLKIRKAIREDQWAWTLIIPLKNLSYQIRVAIYCRPDTDDVW